MKSVAVVSWEIWCDGCSLQADRLRLHTVELAHVDCHTGRNAAACRAGGARQESSDAKWGLCSMQIQKILGKGSYGTAYRAKRHSDGKLYAIKVCLLSKKTFVITDLIRVQLLVCHGVVPSHQAIRCVTCPGGRHPEDVGG